MPQAEQFVLNPLAALLELGRRARHAGSARELEFMAVNDSHALAPYRQAALWLAASGIRSLSGVVQVEANAPYALWLGKVCQVLSAENRPATALTAAELPPALAAEWQYWLPAYGLWLPLPAAPAAAQPNELAGGGLLFARDVPWSEQDIALLSEWCEVWHFAWQGLFKPPLWSWSIWRARLANSVKPVAGRRWWQQKSLRWVVLALLVFCFPVRLTVLAPGELVPAQPVVIRASIEGVIDSFHVQPNQVVKKDQPLFGFDEALIQSRLDVARQALATAETEYRQATQQALVDAKYKAQLSVLTGKIEEKRAEASYLADQLQRARVLAPQDGIVLFDDPSEWTGKPVAIGERIMRIATPGDVEVEAWLPVADAIPLPENAAVNLYLNASPLSPVAASLRYLAHDAVSRPDGSYAYRLRAKLAGATEHRVGLKGTARVNGGWVTLGYWMLRRPLAWVRSTVGW